jgi:hypothetical protein
MPAFKVIPNADGTISFDFPSSSGAPSSEPAVQQNDPEKKKKSQAPKKPKKPESEMTPEELQRKKNNKELINRVHEEKKKIIQKYIEEGREIPKRVKLEGGKKKYEDPLLKEAWKPFKKQKVAAV